MESPILDLLRSRIQWTHEWILEAIVGLSAEQLRHRFGPTSPPLAWTLWHLARSADRFQAGFSPGGDHHNSDRANLDRELWHSEGMAAKWKLEPAKLGNLEMGTGMTQADAAALAAQVEPIELLEYTRRAFSAADQALTSLTDAHLLGDRPRMIELPADAAGESTNHLAEILFHFSHASRHLGMIEALRATFDREGTFTN